MGVIVFRYLLPILLALGCGAEPWRPANIPAHHPAIAEKPWKSHYVIRTHDGDSFAKIDDQKKDMVWDAEKQGWWVNQNQWLPASTPFEIEQHPIE